ncbi:MAG: serine hydrolase domain-containing protein [Acidimicrobiales bacterium]
MKIDPDAAGFDAGRLARIDEHLNRAYIRTEKVAGCQVVVARHGVVAHWSSLGNSDRERAQPVEDDTIWRLYSMTKPITGVALLTLYEQGRMQLTDPIERFLPEWRDVRVKERQDDGTRQLVSPRRPISVRDVMMHMSGIGFGPASVRLDFASLGNSNAQVRAGLTLESLSELLAGEPLRFHPGERWLYSWSTDICARLVEVISGERFDAYLQRTIFDPLGMADTGFSVREGAADRFAALYGRGADKRLELRDDPRRSGYLGHPSFLSGGGGLVGTAGDYLRFCSMLLGGGELDGVRVLSRPTVELMCTNHIPDNGELRNVAVAGGYGEVGFDGTGFGLTVAVGLGPVRTGGVGPAGDYMWGGAASTLFWIDPIEDLVVVFMTQLIPSGTFGFRAQLRSIVYGAIAD